jgi:hypothetical protein
MCGEKQVRCCCVEEECIKVRREARREGREDGAWKGPAPEEEKGLGIGHSEGSATIRGNRSLWAHLQCCVVGGCGGGELGEVWVFR